MSVKLITSKLIQPLIPCFTIIPLLLSIFLLLGCYNVSQTSTYLVEYHFNGQSPLYNLITTAYSASPETKGLQRVKVRTGYMGICIDNIPEQLLLNISLSSSSSSLSSSSLLSTTTSLCYPRKNITQGSPLYTDLTIKLSEENEIKNSTTSTSSTKRNLQPDIQLNLLNIAQVTAIDITHPYLLILTIILALVLLLSILYDHIPLMPYKRQVRNVSIFLSLVVVLICGMSCIWTHIGVKAAFELVKRASFGVLEVKEGKKALVMGWVSFVFYVFVGFGLWGCCCW